MEKLTPQLLLNAYANGYFPMAEDRDADELHWFHPEERGVIPLDAFHIPKSLAKFLKHNPFSYSTNRAFRDVMLGCAERDSTWINNTIIDLYCELHEIGHAHSVEVWANSSLRAKRSNPELDRRVANAPRDDEILVGGLYGVSLGGAFFGESMFSRTTNASKAALVHLVSLMNDAGYVLLDTQYVNDHLKQFGIIEIPRDEYLKRLEAALQIKPQNPFSLD
ncbi:MAG: leucyl/phenylalanyl-tRNA--protein transferase [Rickettsiales bacterium]